MLIARGPGAETYHLRATPGRTQVKYGSIYMFVTFRRSAFCFVAAVGGATHENNGVQVARRWCLLLSPLLLFVEIFWRADIPFCTGDCGASSCSASSSQKSARYKCVPERWQFAGRSKSSTGHAARQRRVQQRYLARLYQRCCWQRY